MEILQKYCTEDLVIDGLNTFIISPEFYNVILHDTELFDQLNLHGFMKNAVLTMIENARNIRSIMVYLAFVKHEKRHIAVWEPINVCKYKNHFYHVGIRYELLCRKCNYMHKGFIIMPKSEYDPIFLEKQYLENYKVPDLFKKIPCEKCGNLLQNHLLII